MVQPDPDLYGIFPKVLDCLNTDPLDPQRGRRCHLIRTSKGRRCHLIRTSNGLPSGPATMTWKYLALFSSGTAEIPGTGSCISRWVSWVNCQTLKIKNLEMIIMWARIPVHLNWSTVRPVFQIRIRNDLALLCWAGRAAEFRIGIYFIRIRIQGFKYMRIRILGLKYLRVGSRAWFFPKT